MVGEANDAIGWMRTLPLFIEFPNFVVVHACWNNRVIRELRSATRHGVLSDDQFVEAADSANPMFALAEVTTKGPEVDLPEGYSFNDKDGTSRRRVRTKWWESGATSWGEVAMYVPDTRGLPDTSVPQDIADSAYPSDAKPIFFGHYWLTGAPRQQARNVLCLDYSAGKDGPLIAYHMAEDANELSLENLVVP